MALVHRLGQRMADAGADPDHRRLLDAELHRNGVGRHEADAADVADEPIRVLRHHLRGIRTIGPEYPLVGQKKSVSVAVRNASGRRRWSKLDEWLAGAKDGAETGLARDVRSLREPPLTGALPYW